MRRRDPFTDLDPHRASLPRGGDQHFRTTRRRRQRRPDEDRHRAAQLRRPKLPLRPAVDSVAGDPLGERRHRSQPRHRTPAPRQPARLERREGASDPDRRRSRGRGGPHQSGCEGVRLWLRSSGSVDPKGRDPAPRRDHDDPHEGSRGVDLSRAPSSVGSRRVELPNARSRPRRTANRRRWRASLLRRQRRTARGPSARRRLRARGDRELERDLRRSEDPGRVRARVGVRAVDQGDDRGAGRLGGTRRGGSERRRRRDVTRDRCNDGVQARRGFGVRGWPRRCPRARTRPRLVQVHRERDDDEATSGEIGYASVGGVAFATRGPSARSFALTACLTHPVDDRMEWWISKLTTSTCP